MAAEDVSASVPLAAVLMEAAFDPAPGSVLRAPEPQAPTPLCAGIGNLITMGGFFAEPFLKLGSDEQARR